MFERVNELVFEQGELVDHINYNIETADRNVEAAVVDLNTVNDGFDPSHKWHYLLLLVIFVYGTTVCSILYYKHHM